MSSGKFSAAVQPEENDADLPDLNPPQARDESRRRLEDLGYPVISGVRIPRNPKLDDDCPDIMPRPVDQPCSSRNS